MLVYKYPRLCRSPKQVSPLRSRFRLGSLSIYYEYNIVKKVSILDSARIPMAIVAPIISPATACVFDDMRNAQRRFRRTWTHPFSDAAATDEDVDLTMLCLTSWLTLVGGRLVTSKCCSPTTAPDTQWALPTSNRTAFQSKSRSMKTWSSLLLEQRHHAL